MLTLTLFRHAKSAWENPGLKDFDRPLSERGLKAAPRMGAFMVAHDLQPDLILASPSKRTTATCALALEEFPAPPPVRFEKVLYLASPTTIINLVKELPDNIRHAMVVGHNPGLHELALQLAGSGPRDLMTRLKLKFPTAALAEIHFSEKRWVDLQAGAGKLVRFVVPRELDNA